MPAEALTSPALLSQRERREKEFENKGVSSCSPLSLWERGVRGVRASKGRPLGDPPPDWRSRT
jgi:hypothetical protein